MRPRAPHLHGGLLGAIVALMALGLVAFSARVLHAPLLQAPDEPQALRGPRGFVQGWQRAGSLRWNVVSERSAHHALLVRVEMADPDRARELAERLVPAAGEEFAEILIYVYRPAGGARLAERRIRWTPAAGYDELVLLPAPRPPLRPDDGT